MTNGKLRLESSDGKQSSVLAVEKATLLVSWKSFGDAGMASHRLSTLSPDFAYHETFRGNPAGPFQLGLFGVLIIAFTALTSLEIEGKPAIFILGGAIASIGFLVALTRLPKTRNTLIMKNDETGGVVVDHSRFDPGKLDTFLGELKKAILENQAHGG